MVRDWKDIPRFKDVTDEQWNDWQWQVRNRLTEVEDFEQVLNLTDKERADLQACMGKFRVAVTPYYASLIDPDDGADPVRMQAVPTPEELVIHKEDLKDAVAEDVDSPTPRHHAPLSRPRALRGHRDVLRCTAATAPGAASSAAPRAASPRKRSTTPSPTSSARPRSATCSSAAATRSCFTTTSSRRSSSACAPSRTSRSSASAPACRSSARSASRPSSCAMLKKYHPLYVNTHFNHPNEITPEADEGLRDARRRRHPARQPERAAARRQRLRQRHEAPRAEAASRSA